MAGRVRSFDDKEIEVLRALARRLKKDRDWSGKQLGDALGIAQQNASRFVATGSTAGMDRTTANKLAELAGFRDVEHALLETGVLAELRPVAPGKIQDARDARRDRDIAVRLARKMGYSDAVIDAVVHRYQEKADLWKPMKWWIERIVLESLARAGDPPDPPPPPASTRPEALPSPTPARRTGRSGTEG